MEFVSRDCFDLGEFYWNGERRRFLITRCLHKIVASISLSINYEDDEYEENVSSNMYEMCFDHSGLPIVRAMISRYWCERG